MTVGERLKNRRKEKKISLRHLAYKVGFSHTNIADIEKGIVKKIDSIKKIMDALEISEDEKKELLLKLDYEKSPESIKKKLDEKNNISEEKIAQVQMIKLPVYGRAAAGNGYINMENIIRTEYLVAIPGEDFPKGAFIAEVYGESMFPTLLDGDFAIVDPDCNDKNINNQICVVTYNGQTFIKRVVKKEKYVVLMSDNPDRVKYEDIIVPTDEYSDLVCHGIVIECRRKFKRR
ncbi:XRE family transcriptional regulator [Cetobacterium sp.]|uniref:XRE family transcriptional regulator n=1 Tax=Cetobacterium sp. TaxID=2071632 RepID=UPI003EE59024